jgi:hypothetical protein
MSYAATAPGCLCIAADVTGTSAAPRQSPCGDGPAAQCGHGAGRGVALPLAASASGGPGLSLQ